MANETNYRIGKSLILDKTIKTFDEIFVYVPKTNFADDLRMHNDTITNRINNPGTFSIEELAKIAGLLEIDPIVIITMAYNQYDYEKKSIKKK